MNSTMILAVVVVSLGMVASGQPNQDFKITTRKAEDTVLVQTDKEGTILVVKSPTGIGQAVIARPGVPWPKTVRLRLHLKGLENFRAVLGQTTLTAAVSIHEGKAKLRLWKDGNEEALLDEKSPFWIHLRIVGGDGQPAKEFPLQGGHFEMTLPRAFLAGDARTLTLHWIDFYRN